MGKELIAIVSKDGYIFDWQETDKKVSSHKIEAEERIYEEYLEDKYNCLLNLGFLEKHFVMSNSMFFIFKLSKIFADKLIKIPEIENLREKVEVTIDDKEAKEILEDAPFMYSEEYLSVKWIKNLFKSINISFIKQIKEYEGKVWEYISSINPNVHKIGKVFFHLVENKKGNAPFAFLATYSDYILEYKKVKHMPLKNALIEYGKDSKKLLNLLSSVIKAAKKSKFVNEILDSKEIFHPLSLNATEAYTFLKEVSIYEECGILCRIPNWWQKKKYKSKVSITFDRDIDSAVDQNSILNFNASVSIGEEELDIEEFRKLKNETEGLLLIKGKWVEVDHKNLSKTLELYEKVNKFNIDGNINIIEAMNFSINANKEFEEDDGETQIEIKHGKWLEETINKLINPKLINEINAKSSFKAKLREYQKVGLNWLYFMKKMRLGACLADDMGLGKTIEILALLDYINNMSKEKTLLILPASLIGNWAQEIDKFAPDISYYILHPSINDDIEILDKPILDKNDLFITTYAMARRLTWISNKRWDNLILDEGQAIKNPSTKQTKMIKKIEAEFKVVLTGTPIENRLTDLWSLFDFLNKGLLGGMREFKDYQKRVKDGKEGYSKLRKIVTPFILRRSKTDKTIISDLPDKVEMKVYSLLTKKQAMLYQSQVDKIEKMLNSKEEGIERKGLILSSITKFKQICNHPDHFLGLDSYIEQESGKFQRLRELCETILEKRERVLIFTQFKSIIDNLDSFMQSIFKHKGLVIHGSTTVSKRKDIVEKFQGEEYIPYMILSLKAGGVGLNLTKANHVIHFDRWWNPAVENQATDRAFRIGQHRNVLVHKFITKGTIEEKIDIIIEEKKNLSDKIISDSTSSIITKMNNEELMDLFRLSI